GKVKVKTGWTDDRIPAGIAEAIQWLQSKCRRIEPFRRSRIRERLAHAGRVRAVISDVGIGTVDARKGVNRKSGSPGNDGPELPAAQNRVQKPILNIQRPSPARRQIVKAGDHQPLSIVESR